jgi:dTDP-4-amino-4,6-dideoxygalactose transaminase
VIKVGQEEIDAVADTIRSGKLFRYHEGSACEMFEKRYAEYLDARHVALCSSGTAALTAALVGLGIGPGDEVLVPAHTYMSTAIAVLAVGAIPVIVEVDESITIDPEAVRGAVGPRTRAVIPVHMWGALCDMAAILAVAERESLLVVEDACQCVGGRYRGRAAGVMGHAGAVSFNYYKNMTCGEGGAVITGDDLVAQRARCMIDPCSFYWEGRQEGFVPFLNSGSRLSELQAAMLNAQLDRLPALLAELREVKERILDATFGMGLTPTPRHSPEGECATALMYLLPSKIAAETFSEAVSGTILLDTGRHTFIIQSFPTRVHTIRH